MKARIENEKIVTYNNLPSSLTTEEKTILGLEYSSKEYIESLGFYNVVSPEVDNVNKSLGGIYFDESKKIFTYEVIDNNQDLSLDEMKINAIAELKTLANKALSSYDWYASRKVLRGLEVPSNVLQSIEKIVVKTNEVELAINNAKTKEDLIALDKNI